jgi:peptidoglycan biosynthesis protein MviN/MurJ (putative lipid II flippase)
LRGALSRRLSVGSDRTRALVGTLLGSAPSFVLPFVITAHFGAGRLTDAYFIGLGFAVAVAELCNGVVGPNAVPVLQNEKRAGTQALGEALKRIGLQATAATAGLYLAVGFVGGYLLIGGQDSWTAAERRVGYAVIVILLAFVVMAAAATVLSAALYALGDFVRPTLSVSFRSVVPLAGLSFFDTGNSAMLAVAGLLVCGETLRVGYLWRELRRRLVAVGRVGARREAPGFWRTALPAGLSQLVANANPVIDRAFAASLGAGAVTVLDLSERVLYAPMMALLAFFVPVAAVRWGELGVEGSSEIAVDFWSTIKLAIALSVAVIVVGVVATQAVGGVAGDRVFGAPVGQLQVLIAILLAGLPAGLLIALAGRLLTSLRRTALFPAFAVVGVVVNVVGDFVGVALLGLEGIALASTITRWATAAAFLFVCRRELKNGFSGRTLLQRAEQAA